MSKISPRVESVLITSRNVTAFDQHQHGKVNKLLSNLPPKNMMNKMQVVLVMVYRATVMYFKLHWLRPMSQAEAAPTGATFVR